MRAVGYQRSLPIADDAALVDIELPTPEPSGRDLLVEVRAVSVNPVDTKVRPPCRGRGGRLEGAGLGRRRGGRRGRAARRAGSSRATRCSMPGPSTGQGTNAEYHLVDERIVGRKPASLSWAEAAALPLTAITAWETLFDRLDVRRPVPGPRPGTPYHRRRRRRGFDDYPARTPAYGAHRNRHSVAARDAAPGSARWAPTTWSTTASRWRPRWRARHRCPGLRLLDHEHRRPRAPRS